MSGRIEKSTNRPKKTEERHRLLALIEQFGVEVMPCSFCQGRHFRCEMMEGVSRCKECVRRGRSCDGLLVGSTIRRVVDADDRLKVEEEKTEEKLLAAQAALSEAVAKLVRIRKQRASLKTRGVDLARRGAASLDELDALEREEAEAAISAQASGAVGVIDWSVLSSGFYPELAMRPSPGGASSPPGAFSAGGN